MVLTASASLVAMDPADASSLVEAKSIALSRSANCVQGDVEITYSANGVSRQAASLTSDSGATLDQYETAAYQPVYDGTEFILTQANVAPAAGTVLGVYVTLGNTPPTAENAEFFLLYRCDTMRNDRGGTNVVLMTCVGDYGTCPKTAQEALAPPPTQPTTADSPTTAPPAGDQSAPAQPVVATPRFTG